MIRTIPIVLTALLCAVAEVAAQTEGSPSPPGRLVDVGGHDLHLHCVGDGEPVVVFDTGAGAWSIHARSVQERIVGEADVRACAYDRAGLGWSEAGPDPRTSRRLAGELHALLDAAGLEPPYVLVGHSLGGWNVRLLAEAHPEDVAGVVLAESAHEEQWDRLPAEARSLAAEAAVGYRRAAAAARSDALPEDALPPCTVDEPGSATCRAHAAAMARPVTWETMAAEMEGATESATQVAEAGDLDAIPLAVVSAPNSFDAFAGTGIPVEAANATWMEMQRELLSLSTASTHHVSETGDHRIFHTDPDRVIAAIRDVVERVRGER